MNKEDVKEIDDLISEGYDKTAFVKLCSVVDNLEKRIVKLEAVAETARRFDKEQTHEAALALHDVLAALDEMEEKT